jgi:hypothetical protein
VEQSTSDPQFEHLNPGATGTRGNCEKYICYC